MYKKVAGNDKQRKDAGNRTLCPYRNFSQAIITLVVSTLSTNSLKIAKRICQFSQYLGTKLDMLFEIAKSVEIIIIFGKTCMLL